MEAVLAAGTLQRLRVAGLAALAARPRMLIVGDGHGRSTEGVLRAMPEATITIVEMSPRMIEVARRRLRRLGLPLGRVAWRCADIRTWTAPPATFDVIVTHFVLDCFTPEDVDAVVRRLGQLARRDSIWLLTDFRLPAQGWRRARARVIHRLMYAFFRLVVGLEARALTPPDAALVRSGFVLRRRRLASAGLLHADVWARGRGVRPRV